MRMTTWATAAGFAGCLTILAALTASTAPAGAEEWCGFKDKAGARIHCGYSSLQECKELTGKKNAVCMPDPAFAQQERRRKPSARPA